MRDDNKPKGPLRRHSDCLAHGPFPLRIAGWLIAFYATHGGCRATGLHLAAPALLWTLAYIFASILYLRFGTTRPRRGFWKSLAAPPSHSPRPSNASPAAALLVEQPDTPKLANLR